MARLLLAAALLCAALALGGSPAANSKVEESTVDMRRDGVDAWDADDSDILDVDFSPMAPLKHDSKKRRSMEKAIEEDTNEKLQWLALADEYAGTQTADPSTPVALTELGSSVSVSEPVAAVGACASTPRTVLLGDEPPPPIYGNYTVPEIVSPCCAGRQCPLSGGVCCGGSACCPSGTMCNKGDKQMMCVPMKKFEPSDSAKSGPIHRYTSQIKEQLRAQMIAEQAAARAAQREAQRQDDAAERHAKHQERRRRRRERHEKRRQRHLAKRAKENAEKAEAWRASKTAIAPKWLDTPRGRNMTADDLEVVERPPLSSDPQPLVPPPADLAETHELERLNREVRQAAVVRAEAAADRHGEQLSRASLNHVLDTFSGADEQPKAGGVEKAASGTTVIRNFPGSEEERVERIRAAYPEQAPVVINNATVDALARVLYEANRRKAENVTATGGLVATQKKIVTSHLSKVLHIVHDIDRAERGVSAKNSGASAAARAAKKQMSGKTAPGKTPPVARKPSAKRQAAAAKSSPMAALVSKVSAAVPPATARTAVAAPAATAAPAQTVNTFKRPKGSWKKQPRTDSLLTKPATPAAKIADKVARRASSPRALEKSRKLESSARKFAAKRKQKFPSPAQVKAARKKIEARKRKEAAPPTKKRPLRRRRGRSSSRTRAPKPKSSPSNSRRGSSKIIAKLKRAVGRVHRATARVKRPTVKRSQAPVKHVRRGHSHHRHVHVHRGGLRKSTVRVVHRHRPAPAPRPSPRRHRIFHHIHRHVHRVVHRVVHHVHHVGRR